MKISLNVGVLADYLFGLAGILSESGKQDRAAEVL
jgi:hypothetical protein